MGPSLGHGRVAILAVVHGLVHAQILLIPVLLIPWQEEFHLGPERAGILAAVAYVAYGLSSVPAGHIADGADGRRLLFLSLVGSGVAGLTLATSPSLPLLAVGLALQGLFLGMYHPTGLAVISRSTKDPGGAMGVHGVGGSLGIALGPLAGSLLLTRLPWNLVVAVFALPALALAVAMVSWPPLTPHFHQRTPIAPALRSVVVRPFPMVMAVYFLAGVAYWGALTFLPSHIRSNVDQALPSVDLGPVVITPVAYLLASVLGSGAIGQYLSGRLTRLPRPGATLALLTAGAGVVLFPLGLAPLYALIPLAIAFGFLLFALEPLQNMLVVALAQDRNLGLAFGLSFISVFGMGAVGAAVGGLIVGAFGFPYLFPALAIPLFGSALASWALRQRAVPNTVTSLAAGVVGGGASGPDCSPGMEVHLNEVLSPRGR